MHVRDPPVTKPVQVTERKLSRPVMVKNHVRHSGDRSMASDSDSWSRESALQLRVDRQNAVYAARLQKPRILCNQVLPVPVVRRKEKVPLLHQYIRRAA
jgi:hypothetical protein